VYCALSSAIQCVLYQPEMHEQLCSIIICLLHFVGQLIAKLKIGSLILIILTVSSGRRPTDTYSIDYINWS